MIYDSLKNLEFYARNDAKLAAIRRFLSEHPIDGLSVGRYDLQDGIYGTVCDSETREDGPFEAHRRYADMQVMLSGGEIVEWADVETMTDNEDYCEDGDYQLFHSTPEGRIPVKLLPGYFLILYPQDAHRPLIRLHASQVRKLIFKIPMQVKTCAGETADFPPC